MSHSGLQVAEDGGSHQAIEDISLMRTIPGMTVVVPTDGNEVRLALRQAIDIQAPVYIRLGRLPLPVFTSLDGGFKIGSRDAARGR